MIWSCLSESFSSAKGRKKGLLSPLVIDSLVIILTTTNNNNFKLFSLKYVSYIRVELYWKYSQNLINSNVPKKIFYKKHTKSKTSIFEVIYAHVLLNIFLIRFDLVWSLRSQFDHYSPLLYMANCPCVITECITCCEVTCTICSSEIYSTIKLYVSIRFEIEL